MKKLSVLAVLLLVFVLAISGCAEKTIRRQRLNQLKGADLNRLRLFCRVYPLIEEDCIAFVIYGSDNKTDPQFDPKAR